MRRAPLRQEIQVGPRLLVLAGVAAVVLVVVLLPVGLALGIMVLVYAVRELRRTRPAEQELLTPAGVPVTVRVAQPGRGSAMTALVLGIVATTLGALLIAALAVFWTEVNDYAACRRDANTTQGSDKCLTDLKNAVDARFGR